MSTNSKPVMARPRGIVPFHVANAVMAALRNGERPPADPANPNDRRGAHAAIDDLREQIASLRNERDEEFVALGKTILNQNAAIDDLNIQLAAASLGGGGGGAQSLGTGRGERMSDAMAAAVGDFLKTGRPTAAMHTESDPDGGYTVKPQVADTITKRLFAVSPLRQIARMVSLTNSDTWEELSDPTEAEAKWVGEREDRPDTANPGVGKLSVVAHEMYAQPKATQKLLEDSSINVAEWLVEKVTSQFSRKEGSAFVTGDGNGKPRGFLAYDMDAADDDSRAWGTMQYVPTGDASGFLAPTDTVLPSDCLVNLVYSLKPEYWPGAHFLMNRKTAAVVRKWKDAEGRYLWTDSLVAGQPPMLLGFPVLFAEDMPSIGANAFPIAFGNFREGYTIVDRLGVNVLRDPYSNKPYVRFYTRKRVGGAVHNSEAIKLLKVATS